MPIAEFGENINFSTTRFSKLKSKGDKITLRILGAPFYDGKHFMEDPSSESGWNVVPCPRINEKGDCEICNQFFAAHKSAKKEGLNKTETAKLTNPFKVAISFYFPILNRETEEFEVFQTSQGVRTKIEELANINVKVLERDLIVIRTEKPGSEYYMVTVIDSADTKELTDKEKEEVEKGKKVDLGEYINGTEEESEDVVEDINF